jgi:seryl-tRNA synthetase
MKIRNVELRTSQRSVGSLDSSGMEELTMLSSRSHPDGMEEAIQSLSIALKELHTELRDKTMECEVIYETANALSSALKESEQLLAEKSRECEQLALKLQMVTFREVDDDPMTLLVEDNSAESTNDIIEEAEAMLKRSALLTDEALLTTIASGSKQAEVRTAESKASTGNKKKIPGCSVSTSTSSSSDKSKPSTKSSPIDEASPIERHPGPVSVDDAFLEIDDTELSEESPKPAEVRQAHFYQVIQERDKALQTVRKLSKEVKCARKKNEELKSRLDRSTVLNELAYIKQSPQSRKKRSVKQESPQLLSHLPKIPAESPEFQMGTTATSKSRPHVARQLSWLRRGKDLEEHNDAVKVVCPADVLMFGRSDVAEQEYLRAIASNDADRAAGCDFERASL